MITPQFLAVLKKERSCHRTKKNIAIGIVHRNDNQTTSNRFKSSHYLHDKIGDGQGEDIINRCLKPAAATTAITTTTESTMCG